MAQSTFQSTRPTTSGTQLDCADDWQEFAASEMSSGLDLVALGGGRPARMIVVKEYGDLYAVTVGNESRRLTGLPTNFVHLGKTRAIEPGQPVAIIVYW